MAKFGLSDSDSEPEDSFAHQSKQVRHHQQQQQHDYERGDEERIVHSSDEPDDDGRSFDVDSDSNEDDEGPPRHSLNDDEQDEMEDDDDVDEDEEEARSTRETSFISTSTLEQSRPDDDDDDDYDESYSTTSSSRRSITPRKRIAPSTNAIATTTTTTNQHQNQNQSWAGKLRLEPKRVAVMQASFFQQPSTLRQNDGKGRVLTTTTTTGANGNATTRVKEMSITTAAASPFNPRPNASASTQPAPIPQPTSIPTPALDPSPFRSHRLPTHTRLSDSILNGKESNLIDQGMSMNRSYRVGWGPGGQLVSLNGVYRSKPEAKFGSLQVDQIKIDSIPNQDSAVRLLQIQLEHTPIYSSSSNSIPFAVPHPELRFHHFSTSFATQDHSEEADLWKLGSVLFDEIDDLEIPQNEDHDHSIEPYIEDMRRKEGLEEWLRNVVRLQVENELRSFDEQQEEEQEGIEKVFTMLSGHQIERACEKAFEQGDLRLTTLLSQIGGDDEFREDVFEQLVKWREYRIDSHISKGYRRVYELLCGNVGVSEGRGSGKDKVDGVEELHVSEGLDWKRAFGLHLWYERFRISVAQAMEAYEKACALDQRVKKPDPSYILSSSKVEGSNEWKNRSNETPTDPLFQLIKLFTSSTHALEQVLLPINFGSSPLDYRLPWHLYILLSRVLRRRDFEDRVQVDEEEMTGDLEGNSVRADLMTEAYATQLERMGLWTWSAFVLLHLELPEARAKAIQSLLSRSTDLITPESEQFLVQKLQIPSEWIYHAQAVSSPSKFTKYEFYLLAQHFVEAHSIVLESLAPECILRDDLELLQRILKPFDERRVSDWDFGGRLYTDFIEVLNSEKDRLHHGGAKDGASLLKSVLERLGKNDAAFKTRKAKVAKAEMMSRLTVLAMNQDEALKKIQPSNLQESDRLVWIRGASNAFLEKSLEMTCSS